MKFAPYLFTIYLLFGAYLALFGKFKPIIDREFEGATIGNDDNSSTNSTIGRKLLIGRILVVVFSALFWPFFFRNATTSTLNISHPARINDGSLKFQSINGYGPITCQACGHTENITAFTHGMGEHEDGSQCQTCGTFHTIPHNSNKNQCECGGILSREEPIYCPKCKSQRVTYFADYMN